MCRLVSVAFLKRGNEVYNLRSIAAFHTTRRMYFNGHYVFYDSKALTNDLISCLTTGGLGVFYLRVFMYALKMKHKRSAQHTKDHSSKGHRLYR